MPATNQLDPDTAYFITLVDQMDIGVILPQTEIGADPVAVRDFAQAAEGLGYSHILAYDHVIGAHPDREPTLWGPYTHESNFHEPLVLFGYLAGITQRVGLVTGVLVLPQRQTVLVAKQAAEIDLLSGGRLRLGVGVGWNYVEFDSLNEDFSTRGARQVEQVELMRRLWTEALVEYTGRWHRIDRAGLLPLPGRQIPIWFGGFTDAAYRRAIEVGDGFIFGGMPADGLSTLSRIRAWLTDIGRDPTRFGFEAMLNYLPENADSWRGDVEAWRDVGADYVSVRTMGSGFTSVDDHIEAIERYLDAVT